MATDDNECGRKLRTKERKKYVDQEIDEDDIDGKRSYSLEEMLLTDRFGCEMVQEMTGPEFNMEWIQKNGLKRPIVFVDKTGLGLRVPSQNFKISDVKQCVGSRRVLDVMDVSTQKALEMTMKDWVKYFENPERDRLLNVISLEFCHTRLDNYVESPTLVRQIDWVNRVWPRHLKECQTEATNLIQKMKYPKVQKYCLMSVADCYTDWHVDFGGTSVWYHILHGEKIFWLAPPTTKNLDTYVEWTLSAKQGDSFLGDSLEQCQRINLKAGYTFIIPSGWIHAVYTPKDSLVFGGNFLHSFNIENQLLVSRIEEKTYVPLKFRYPFFVELMWYVLDRYLACITGHTYLNAFDETEDAYGDADMIHVDEDSRPPSRNPDSRPPSRTMDDAAADSNKIKTEGGEEAPKLSKSVTIELTRIDAALKKAQGEEDAVSTPGKRPPRRAASDAADGGLKKWVHLTTMELKGLQQIVDHLSGLLQLPVCKRGIPKEMFDAEAVLREIRQILEDHKGDNQELAMSGDPVIGWPESAKKKQQKLKLGYKTYKSTKGPKSKDSSSTVRRRRTRCKQCEACTRGECGECTFCKDMKKFGGPGKMKQTCISRQCMAPVLPCSSVCVICNKEGQINNSDDCEDISMCLMECGICWEITHPSCIYSKFENMDNEGNVNEDLPNSWECPKCCQGGKRGQLKPRGKPGISVRKMKSEEWRSADSEGSQDETFEEEMEMARSPVEGKRVVSKEGDDSRGAGKETLKTGRKSPSSTEDWQPRKRNSAGVGVSTPNSSPVKDVKKAVKKERTSAPSSPSHQQSDDPVRSRKRPASSVSAGSKNGGGSSLNGHKEGLSASVKRTKKEKKLHKLKEKLEHKRDKPSKGQKGKGLSVHGKRRRTRCKECEACTGEDCGKCVFCRDMIKYGGAGTMKKTCKSRQCLMPMLPRISVCKICENGGQINKSVDCKDISICLMECRICKEITHPPCIYKKCENLDNKGIVNTDMPNSWKCPKCCNHSKTGQHKRRRKSDPDKKVNLEESRSAENDWQSHKRNSGSVSTPSDVKNAVKKENASSPNSPSHQQTDDADRVSRKRSSIDSVGKNDRGSAMNGHKEESSPDHTSPSATIKRPKREVVTPLRYLN